MPVPSPVCSDSEWQLLFKILEGIGEIGSGIEGAWLLSGNNVGGSDVLGATNNEDVRMITNNSQIATWFRTGELGLNIAAAPLATLHVKGRSAQSPLYVLINAGTHSFEYTNVGSIRRNAVLFSLPYSAVNTSWGSAAGNVLSSATGSTLIGANAGAAITTQSNNTYVGTNAGSGATGVNATFIGEGSGPVNTGSSNVFVGRSAGAVNTSAFQATYIGTAAGGAVTTGEKNTYLGYHAGEQTSAGGGTNNVAVGNNCAKFVNGNSNVLIGSELGNSGMATASNNVAIGGFALLSSNNVQSCVILGVSASANGRTSSIGIGTSVALTADNQLVIGSASSFVNEEQHFYSGAGVHGDYYRTTTPEGAQASQRGSLAFVDDATTGEVYLKLSGTGNTGWFKTSRIAGSFSQAVVTVATFTVTIGITLSNATYQVNVTPTAAISAALFYVNNKTTTTFDVVYNAAITGTVTFDWTVFP